jgi:hypothetical protein
MTKGKTMKFKAGDKVKHRVAEVSGVVLEASDDVPPSERMKKYNRFWEVRWDWQSTDEMSFTCPETDLIPLNNA